ncbi:hypothetical protein GEMRC1_013040 [Eukaryota sp. GEM-RC1]
MSLRPVRQSILSRPRKSASYANVQNEDNEFEKEKQREERNRSHWNSFESERLRSMFPTAEEKVQLQEEERNFIDSHLARKREIEGRIAAEDRQIELLEVEEAQLDEQIRQEQEESRRDYLRYLLEENKKLAAYRKIQRQKEYEAQIAEDQERGDYMIKKWKTTLR